MKLTILLLCFFSTYFLLKGNDTLGLYLSVISALLLFFKIVQTNGFNSISGVFIIFFIIYSYSAPISVDFGVFEKLLHKHFSYNIFVQQANLAVIGMTLIMSFTKFETLNFNSKSSFHLDINVYYLLIALAICAFSFELINLLRVGGIATLIRGKAHYQSKISELTLTLPTGIVIEIIFAYLFYTNLKIGNRVPFFIKILPLIIISPSILIMIFLGQRGPILGLATIFFIANNIQVFIKKINIKAILVGIIFYLFLFSLYFFRSYFSSSAITGDAGKIAYRLENKEALNTQINPANNEFGANYFNFIKYETDEKHKEKLYGKSYIIGVFTIIPQFMLSFQKPKQITYEFRDKYYREYSKNGRIAGTGFSAILEAYWNFGYFGVLFIFSTIFLIILYLDAFIKKSQNYLIVPFIISLVPICQSFHRAAFSNIFSEIFSKMQIIIICFLLLIIANVFRYKIHSKGI